MCHAIRRNVNLLYILENNGVYGLTKGQFSASADKGSTAKKGEANTMEAIDGVLLALTLGATFVARSFSGDKAQLVPIIKAGLAHSGLCVHRRHLAVRHLQRSRRLDQELRLHARARTSRSCRPISCRRPRRSPPSTMRATVKNVMLHDGGWVRLRKVAADYDPTDRDRAYAYIRERQRAGEVADRPALHLARLAGHARADRHRRSAR